MSRSPLASLSRTPAQLASLLGTIFTPYFLSMPSTEAITTLAQSVSGMKPILTSSFSGLSEPWAQTAARSAGSIPTAPMAAACSTRRRLSLVCSGSDMGRTPAKRKAEDKNEKASSPPQRAARKRASPAG